MYYLSIDEKQSYHMADIAKGMLALSIGTLLEEYVEVTSGVIGILANDHTSTLCVLHRQRR